MPTPILATKLYIPLPRPQAVRRHRLIARLNQGLHRRLTLLSAPAGFGKTTLVSEWLAAPSGDPKRRVAWLSLDEGDNDPARFLAYLIAALQTVAPKMGETVLALLNAPQPPPIELILTSLLNEISAIPDNFILVLDDYHVIQVRPIDHTLTFLLEHLPPQMHLVITTREDPPLALPRLRARGQLTELRAVDLRFTGSEAADFLNEVMGLHLTGQEIAALDRRTEGWIAGLQLAALSMQGHQDISAFILAFAGDHRYIVDYLVEEVLERQPAPVRNFLLQTAILDQLSGPLCAAVTGQNEGNARLDALERGNFFVVPLDDTRHWYRYHHLFADVLRAHLMAEQPDQVPVLHQRASEWYAAHGMPVDAIRHALAAKDYARAASLVELAIPALRPNRQEATILVWLKSLPDDVVRFRPVLMLHYVGALLTSGEMEGIESMLRDVEQWLDRASVPHDQPHADGLPSTEMVFVDEEEFRRLPASIAIYRAGYALARGDVSETVKNALRALELVPEDEHFGRGAAAGLLGLAYWTRENIRLAYQSHAEGMASLQRVGHISDAIGGAIALADIRLAQGRLREAMRIYERGLRLATEQGTPELRGTADMYVGMSELCREYNDLKVATQHLLQSKGQGTHTGFPQNPYRWHVAMARIKEVEGDLDSTLDLLDEAERLYRSDLYPNVRPVAALKARLWVSQGRLEEALRWAREQSLSADDELSYLHEFEHIALARILLAHYTSERADHTLLEATSLLARLLQAAEEGARTGHVIEILVLQSRAYQLQGDIPSALVPLQRALTLAEPEGYRRIFVDEGPPMAALLEVAAQHGIAPNYVRQLLSAFGTVEDNPLVNPNLNPQRTHSVLAAGAFAAEPLSERELEVLRLLATDLDGPEIARQLMVSLNTMRTHTKNIYSKFGVNNRREAIRRAEELALL